MFKPFFCVAMSMLGGHSLCLAQDQTSYDGREGHFLDRPQWISAFALQADAARDHGDYTIQSHPKETERSLATHLRACYQWELDVYPSVRMAESLIQRHREKAAVLETAFNRRVSCRNADRDLFDAPLNASSFDKVIAEIREREFRRTQILSDELDEILLPSQGEALVSELLSTAGVRAFCFPYVASFFGLSESQIKAIRASNLVAYKRIELAKSSRDNSTIKDLQKDVFLSTLRYLPFRAIKTYLLVTKKLNSDEPVSASIPRFPADCREALGKIIQNSQDS